MLCNYLDYDGKLYVYFSVYCFVVMSYFYVRDFKNSFFCFVKFYFVVCCWVLMNNRKWKLKFLNNKIRGFLFYGSLIWIKILVGRDFNLKFNYSL